MRFIKIAVCTLVFSFLMVSVSREMNDETVNVAKEREPLIRAMTVTGAAVDKASVNAWAELPVGKISDKVMEELLKEAMRRSGIMEESVQLFRYEENHRRGVRAVGRGDGFHVVGIVQTVTLNKMVLQQKASTSYLVLNVESDGGNSINCEQWRQKLTQVVTHFGGLPRITTCLEGYLGGKLMKEDWGKCIEKAFLAANATVTDKLVDDNFASYAGYSPDIPDCLQVEDQKVNVHVAMRYSRYDDRTYIMIGSPVITREF